jgi:hypothetical protein
MIERIGIAIVMTMKYVVRGELRNESYGKELDKKEQLVGLLPRRLMAG